MIEKAHQDHLRLQSRSSLRRFHYVQSNVNTYLKSEGPDGVISHRKALGKTFGQQKKRMLKSGQTKQRINDYFAHKNKRIHNPNTALEQKGRGGNIGFVAAPVLENQITESDSAKENMIGTLASKAHVMKPGFIVLGNDLQSIEFVLSVEVPRELSPTGKINSVVFLQPHEPMRNLMTKFDLLWDDWELLDYLKTNSMFYKLQTATTLVDLDQPASFYRKNVNLRFAPHLNLVGGQRSFWIVIDPSVYELRTFKYVRQMDGALLMPYQDTPIVYSELIDMMDFYFPQLIHTSKIYICNGHGIRSEEEYNVLEVIEFGISVVTGGLMGGGKGQTMEHVYIRKKLKHPVKYCCTYCQKKFQCESNKKSQVDHTCPHRPCRVCGNKIGLHETSCESKCNVCDKPKNEHEHGRYCQAEKMDLVAGPKILAVDSKEDINIVILNEPDVAPLANGRVDLSQVSPKIDVSLDDDEDDTLQEVVVDDPNHHFSLHSDEKIFVSDLQDVDEVRSFLRELYYAKGGWLMCWYWYWYKQIHDPFARTIFSFIASWAFLAGMTLLVVSDDYGFLLSTLLLILAVVIAVAIYPNDYYTMEYNRLLSYFPDLPADQQILIFAHRDWSCLLKMEAPVYYETTRIRLYRPEFKVSNQPVNLTPKTIYQILNSKKMTTLYGHDQRLHSYWSCLLWANWNKRILVRNRNLTVDFVQKFPAPVGDVRPHLMRANDIKIKDPEICEFEVRVGNNDFFHSSKIFVSLALVKEHLSLPKAISPYEGLREIENKIIFNLAAINYVNVNRDMTIKDSPITGTIHYLRYKIISMRQKDHKNLPPSGGFLFPVY
jgi:hypothetical protein